MININFSKIVGPIKPAHGVGNGPLCRLMTDKSEEFRAARIPFSRLHDTEGLYGSGIFVNIHCIFPDFDADVNDPDAYYFDATDIYIQGIVDAGTQVFYRLGETIENSKRLKVFVRTPKDYFKWAQICEHIIMHYNEGWANGFHHGIKYWEIWGEPDNENLLYDADPEEYYELYHIAASHLKRRFPNIRIGGYSASGFYSTTRKDVSEWFKTLVPFMEGFFEYITREDKKSPLDFFSWHCYTSNPKEIGEHARFVDSQLKKYGFDNTESLLTEWNYALTWDYEDVKKRKNHFGASMVMASLAEIQKSPVAGGMYYDAEVSRANYCGMFDYHTGDKLKPYYSMLYFGRLSNLATETESTSTDKNVFVVSAANEKTAGVIATNFSDKAIPQKISFDREVIIEEIFETNEEVTNLYKTEFWLSNDRKTLRFNMKPYEVVYIEMKF